MAHFWWAFHYYAIKYFYRTTIMIFFSTQISMHHYIYVQKHMSMYIFLFMHKSSGGDYFIRGVNISLWDIHPGVKISWGWIFNPTPAPGQPELARLICGAHLGPPVLTRKQKRPQVNSLVCDRAAAFCAAGPPEVLSRMSRPVTQAAERERELARARSQWLNQAAPSLPGESVSRGFADRGALEGYPSHYTSLV